jgi:O-methyltransferase
MDWSYLAQRYLGRERVMKLVYEAYNHGVVIAAPMRSRRSTRNHAVMEGEYVRCSSLELVANEILEKEVPGAVAELGVYRGEFARLINIAFPRRKLYLFDTFSGFDNEQVREDREKENVKTDLVQRRLFSDTSVEIVLSKMKYRENCIVFPGVFPESAIECMERSFAFVSLDCDLYRPIYEGLRYFYPKLSSGGYIFIHDYNNESYAGAKQAVRQFAEEAGVAYFPLSDACGSAVISKA